MASVKDVKSEMYTDTILVTPAMALRWLEESEGCNPRKLINQAHVSYLVQEILGNRWQLSPQGLSFNLEGTCTDGQHRLWAVVLAGKSVPMRVTHNVNDSALEIIDGGISPRGLFIRAKITVAAAAIYRFMIVAAQSRGSTIHPSQAHALENEYGRYVAKLVGECPSSAKKFSAAVVRVAAVMSMTQGERETYVTKVYRDLALSHTDCLARAPMDFWTNRVEGDHQFDAKDVYARARFAFTEENELKHVRMMDSYRNGEWNTLRRYVMDALKKHGVLYPPVKEKAGFPRE